MLAAPSAHADHDLAEMLVGAHLAEGLGDIGELVGLVNGQAQLAALYRRPQIGAHQPYDLAHFVRCAGAKGHADVVDTLERVLVEIELALGAAKPPDIDDAAQNLCGFEVAVGDRSRNHVDNQVDSLAAGGFFDVLRPVRLASVDRDVATALLEPRAAGRIGRRAHDQRRAHQLADLHAHQPYAGARALDKQRFATLEPAGRYHRVVHGLWRYREAGSLLVGHVIARD